MLPATQEFIGILLFTLLIKWLISLNQYSGFNTPPTFGDFEAQRHWLEITFNLPPNQWYSYDSSYWGLDYPPLTAIHSLFLGHLANVIYSPWVAFEKSRGFESVSLKIFMRLTVLASELLIATPALYLLSKKLSKPIKNAHNYLRLFLVFLIQPSLALIDHGHFQYNSVMLGLSAWAIYFILKEKFILGAILFSCSLLFKQMALFYALPVFFYLLAKCKKHGILLLLRIAFCTFTTFALIFLIISRDYKDILQIFYRVFPVHRGLWEDKVANIWCASNIFIKLRAHFELSTLIKTSMISTLAAVLPSCIHAFIYPSQETFIYSLVNSSLGFFLLSFQVHEKSIILPAFVITLLHEQENFAVILFNNVAVFSMMPLLIRDGLAFVSILMMFLWVLFTRSIYKNGCKFTFIQNFIEKFTYIAMISIYGLQNILGTPDKFPDLYIVMNVELSAIIFTGFFIYFNIKQFTLPVMKLRKAVKESMNKKNK